MKGRLFISDISKLFLVAEAESSVFLFADVHEGDLIDVLLLNELRVVVLDNPVGILHAHGCQGLGKVGNRNGLDPEDIIGVEKCLEVLSCQEGSLGEGVDGAALWIVRGLPLDGLQALHDVHLCVRRTVVQYVR